jgi:N-methylhydantoinase A
MINIHSIGAGGGSIAWIEGGGLRVGPISAGAEPGPACYGKGGLEPTITDANLVLGRIDPDNFLGGNMVLDKNAAINAVKRIADELNITVEETAEGICKVADAKMADAIKQLTIRKGIDPREFALVSFGGAGPMHACLTAEELGINTIIVPKMPGVFSAWGMLQSDIRLDTVRTIRASVDNISLEEINARYKEMIGEISELLERQRIEKERREYRRIADMRYLGQEYMIRVPFEPGTGTITLETLKKLTETFHKYHHNLNGYNNPNEIVEIVNIRLVGLGKLDKILQHKEKNLYKSKPKPGKINKAIFYGRECETRFFNRRELKSGQKLGGPAVIEEFTATTVVPPGYEVTIDEYKNILITRK